MNLLCRMCAQRYAKHCKLIGGVVLVVLGALMGLYAGYAALKKGPGLLFTYNLPSCKNCPALPTMIPPDLPARRSPLN